MLQNIHANVSNFETGSPKILSTLNFLTTSVILFKMGKHSDFHLSFFQVVSAWRNFAVVTKLIKKNKTIYVFFFFFFFFPGDAVPNLKAFVRILNHNLRSITWSLSTRKASYSLKLRISTWSFMWWGPFIDWLQIEIHPNSLLNFGNDNFNIQIAKIDRS